MKTALKLTWLLALLPVALPAECPLGSIVAKGSSVFGVGRVAFFLSVKYTNTSDKTIVGAKFRPAWVDATADWHYDLEIFTSNATVKPSADRTEKWPEPPSATDARGWVVYPVKLLYQDGSTWQIDPKEASCFGQVMRSKATILTVLPAILPR